VKKLTAVILTVVLAAAGGGLFHALDVPAGWLTGAMIAVAAGAMARVPLHMPAPAANGALVLLGMSMGAGVTPDTLRQAAAWPLSILVLAVSVVASIAVCSFWFERIHGWDRATARFAAIPGALPAVLAMAVGTSADLPRVALAQSLRLVTLVAVMPPLLRWLAVPSTGTTTSIGTPGNLSGFLLLLGASAATAGLMYRMRFPGGVLLGAMMASAVLHGTGMIQGLLPPDLLAAGFTAIGALIGSRFRGVKLSTLLAILRPSLESVVLALVISGMCAGIASALLDLPMGQIWLAYTPGGIEAMSIVAFALGFDVAFVGMHHVVRFAGLGLIVPWWQTRWSMPASAPGNQSATDNEVSARTVP
jgi:membrane AbrB-like protein